MLLYRGNGNMCLCGCLSLDNAPLNWQWIRPSVVKRVIAFHRLTIAVEVRLPGHWKVKWEMQPAKTRMGPTFTFFWQITQKVFNAHPLSSLTPTLKTVWVFFPFPGAGVVFTSQTYVSCSLTCTVTKWSQSSTDFFQGRDGIYSGCGESCTWYVIHYVG